MILKTKPNTKVSHVELFLSHSAYKPATTGQCMRYNTIPTFSNMNTAYYNNSSTLVLINTI